MTNYNIEKFEGEFEKEESGCSILINSTVNYIKDLDVLGLYCYLSCRPPKWRIHPKHLIKNFNCGKDKIYRLLGDLVSLGLLVVTEVREKGRFKGTKYKLLTKPSLPCPDSPCPEKPDTENKDAYKTKKEKNKEVKTTTTNTIQDSPPDNSPTTESSSYFFKEVVNLKTNSDDRLDSEFLENVEHHVENNSDMTKPRYQRERMVIKLLKTLKERNQTFYSTGYLSEREANEQNEKKKMEDLEGKYKLYFSQFINDRDFLKLPATQGKNPKTFEEWLSANKES